MSWGKGGPQHEGLYQRVKVLGRLRTTGLRNSEFELREFMNYTERLCLKNNSPKEVLH